MKKFIVISLVIFGIHLLLNMVFGGLGSSLYQKVPELWKPMGPKWTLNVNILYVIFSFLFVYFYFKLKDALPSQGLKKGLYFGLIIFLFSYYPSIGVMYFTMTIPGKLLFIWASTAAIKFIVSGLMVSFLDRKIH